MKYAIVDVWLCAILEEQNGSKMSRIRKSFSVEKKLEIISWHKENGASLHRTSTEFGIDRKNLRDWIKNESLLQMNNFGKAKKKRKIGCGQKPLSEELDEELYDFFLNERESGRVVNNRLLSEQAIKIAKKIGILTFKASAQYIANFKKRYNISMRVGTTDSQKTPELFQEEVKCFFKCVKQMRIKNDYTDYNIANMDQTMCRFDMPSKRTNNMKGESSVRITNMSCTKRGFSVALSARASGNKMPAFCVLKESSGKIPLNVLTKLVVPENVRVTATTNGWMSRKTLEEWLCKVWKESEDDVRRLLVLDRAPIHVTNDAASRLAELNTDLVLIPPGCTRLLQPADVCWIKPFKDQLREHWKAFMRKTEKTKKGNTKSPSRQDVLRWVSEAWECVSEDLIRRSFKKCGISNALDGSEDGEFHSSLSQASNSIEVTDEEICELIFDDELSDEDFEGFSSESET